MSELHSLIRRSIIDRGLNSVEAREEVYQQARTAIIRELWSYDPPLAEDEIDARVGQFDLAIAALEDDLAGSFATRKGPPRAIPPPATRSAPVFEGYDHDTDYVPTYVAPARSGRPEADRSRGFRQARADTSRAHAAETSDPLALRSAAIEAALRSNDEASAPAEDPPASHGIDAGYEYDDEAADEIEALDDEALDDEAVADEMEPPASWRWDDEQSRSPEYYPEEPDEGEEAEAVALPSRRFFAKPRARWPAAPAWTKVLPRLGDIDERMRVRFLIGAIAGLAIVFLVVAGFIVSSLLPGSTEPPDLAAATGAAAADDGTPADAGSAPAKPPRTKPAPPDALQSFTIFDGTDPTVFESSPGNPVRFDKSGSFARISSASSDQGARVIVGPGIATRLSGQTVRVTLVARAPSENGAAGLRFAYENGLAISPWQTANLTNQFQSFNLSWRVPTMRADPNVDQLYIEPGIPGDGTAADIQQIRIDVIKSSP